MTGTGHDKPQRVSRPALFLLMLLAVCAPAQAASTRSIELRLEALESRLPDADRLAALERSLKSSGVTAMVDEINQMQAELRSLRGELEQLSHEIRTQRERDAKLYQDLDRRLQAIEQRSGAPGLPGAAAGSATVQAGTAVGSADATAPPPADASAAEQADYQAAFEVLKKGDYRGAARAFTLFLEKHPSGAYTGNALYWLGEASYVSQDYPAALAAFQKLVGQHPGNTKLPGAMLKIGYIHYETRNYTKAREVLEKLRRDYPDSNVSSLAAERLERMRKEGV